MIDIIQNNPFRILGVYADASAADIKRNETKIRRFLEVNKQVSFPTDELGNLPAPIRTVEALDNALSEISLPQSKIKFACFWYCNNAVRDIVNKSIDGYANNSISDAINAFAQLLSSRVLFNEFTSSIDDTLNISPDEVSELYVNTLMEQLPEKDYPSILNSKLASDALREKLNSKQIAIPVEQIHSLIDACKKVEKGDNASLIDATKKLWEEARKLLEQISQKIGENSPQFGSIRESVVKQVLQSCITAVNAAQDNILEKGGATYRYVTKSAYQLIQEISSIPVSSFLSQRIETNLDVIKNLAEKAEDRIANETVGDEHYCWYCGKMKAEPRFKYGFTMYKETYRSYFPRRQVQYKKLPVFINRCEDCRNIHENLSDGAWKTTLLCLAPNIILLICLLATDHSWAWTLLGVLFSFVIALAINNVKSSNRCKKMGIREEEDFYEHPLVKYLYKEGWQLSEPSA